MELSSSSSSDSSFYSSDSSDSGDDMGMLSTAIDTPLSAPASASLPESSASVHVQRIAYGGQKPPPSPQSQTFGGKSPTFLNRAKTVKSVKTEPAEVTSSVSNFVNPNQRQIDALKAERAPTEARLKALMGGTIAKLSEKHEPLERPKCHLDHLWAEMVRHLTLRVKTEFCF